MTTRREICPVDGIGEPMPTWGGKAKYVSKATASSGAQRTKWNRARSLSEAPDQLSPSRAFHRRGISRSDPPRRPG